MPRAPSTLVPWTLLTHLGELWLAAPQVIALRTAQMMTPAVTDQARRTLHLEMHQMGSEKVAALQESLFAMWLQGASLQAQWSMQMAQWLWTLPWQWMGSVARGSTPTLPALPTPDWTRVARSGVAPVHRRATANLRRLRKAIRSRPD